MRKAIALMFLGTALAAAALAVVPQKWTFRTYEEFLRGKFNGISVSADGILTLSPREDRIEGPAEDFYLSFVMTAEGVGYLGTGHDGKIYRLPKEGKPELFAQTTEMDVTALAMDKKGILYAATSPNGRIYKIVAPGKVEEFFNPDEKYIWAILFDEDGRLLAAVGESGGIYAISPQGDGRMIFKAQENHVLCLKFDRNRDIVAGTGGGGLVYRVSRTGKTAVLFESPYEEVRSLAFDLDGNLYAAAGGTVRSRRDEPALPVSGRDADVTISVTASPVAVQAAGTQAAQSPRPASKPPSIVLPAGREPGALFRIGPDVMAKRLWSSLEEMIYSLYWNETEKRVYFGTGPKGRLYALDKDEKTTLVIQKLSEQIFALVPVGVRTYVLADNPCQLGLLYPEQRFDGDYVSPVLDARQIAAWGRIGWDIQLPPQATCQLQTRSGNSVEPGPSWSDWSPPYQKSDGEPVLSPKGRYLQFRALFKTASGKASPQLSKVNLHYLQTNVAPVVLRFEALAPNEVFLKLPGQEEVILGAERRSPDAGAKKDDVSGFAMSKKAERKGWQTLQWDADDENDDPLVFTLWIRQEGDKDWRSLEDGWTETTYAFNSANFPDGTYFLKLTASDRLSNPSGLDLKGEKTSSAIVIDNTPPILKNLQVTREGNALAVSFTAEDQFSPIKEAKALVRPDDWRVVFPEDGICDSKAESFKLKIGLNAAADRMVTILVKDAVGNAAVVKQMF